MRAKTHRLPLFRGKPMCFFRCGAFAGTAYLVGDAVPGIPVGAIINRPKCRSTGLHVEWYGVGLRYVFA